MKQLFTLLSALLFGSTCFSQWAWQPASTGEIIQEKMTFSTANSGFMVGTNALPNGNAKIAKTNNGGQTWTTVYSLPPAITPSTLTLNDIQIVDQSVAYACGGYGIDDIRGVIVKSTDGGTTWDTLSHNIDVTKFFALHFFDATHGLVVGPGMWHTADGGANWTPVTVPSGTESLVDLCFANATLGFGVVHSTSGLIRTTDGGVTWSSVSLPTSDQTNKVTFFDADHGLLACNNGTILYTTNGGTTWTSGTNADADQTNVLCVAMTSASVGYAGTSGGKILHTVNGGQSWTVGVDATTLSAALMLASIYDISFPTPQTGYACGSLLGTLIKTTNGGGIAGITELHKDVLSIAPNPATDHITFDGQDVQTVQLFSSEGRLIQEFKGSELNGTLYVGQLPRGAYVLKTFGHGTVSESLFIKE